jgi:hypothetical protein
MIELAFVIFSLLALFLIGIRDPVRLILFLAFMVFLHINFRG